MGTSFLYHINNYTLFVSYIGLVNFCNSISFLSINDVLQRLHFYKSIMSQEASDLVEYFKSIYIGRNTIITRRNVIKNIPVAFPASVWNVHEVTLNDGQRTNNQTEG